jgi:NADH-quinone oxidoreductase subunit A
MSKTWLITRRYDTGARPDYLTPKCRPNLRIVTLADYAPILVMFILAAGFVAVSLLASRIFRPDRPTPEKLEPYECGIIPEVEPSQRFPVKFYLVAMLFVIFDVETVFMFPWAVIFNKLLLFGLIEMMVFILILVVGYYYAWQKGALDWV